MSGPFDYEGLRKALDRTLGDVETRRISMDQVLFDEEVELGQGGFSTVHAAKLEDRSGSVSDVAVKVLRAGVRKKDVIHLAAALARELRVWATLDHPNILRLLGFRLDIGQESAWIVSPGMFNGNARDFFKQTKPDFGRRLQTVREMTEALVYLHEHEPPICHGDLKPDNLLINNGGHVVLSDFGLTAIPDTTRSGLTTTRSLKGTVRYLSPELLEEEEPIRTLKTDIWAYGCVVGELFTDEMPYSRSPTDFHITQQIMKGDSPLPPEHPQLPTRLLRWAWNRTATERPHIQLCRDILSNPLPCILLSKNTGYNDRDLETASYTGAAFSMYDNPRWDGWAATSAHRSCRLSPVPLKGFGLFNTSLIETFASSDGLSFGFLYASDNSSFEIVVHNTITDDRVSLKQDYDPLAAEVRGCSRDLQFFGVLFRTSYDADGNKLPDTVRIWHIASGKCVLGCKHDGNAESLYPRRLFLPRTGLCVLMEAHGEVLIDYGGSEDPQTKVVQWSHNYLGKWKASLPFDDSYVAIKSGSARTHEPPETEVTFFETEGLRKMGTLKLPGLDIINFVLAPDGKSALLVENPHSRAPRTIWHGDLTAVFSTRSSNANIPCPIRCIASRVAATSPQGLWDTFWGEEYDPDIKISPDGTHAVVAEPTARTVLDLQTGLILREFWVEPGASQTPKHPPLCFHLGLDRLSKGDEYDNIYCIRYDVDPPCPRTDEDCSFHHWNPIPFAAAVFTPAEIPNVIE